MNFPPLTVVLLLTASALRGADLQPLLDNSPFGRPPPPESSPAAAAEVPLEFRSLVVEAGTTYFSVFDPAAQRGYWLAEDDAEGLGGITVSSYDAAAGRLVVSQGGRSYELLLKQANIVAGEMPVVASGAPAPPGNARVRTTASNGADARRLEAVAAEVRRRRALRQAAAAGNQ